MRIRRSTQCCVKSKNRLMRSTTFKVCVTGIVSVYAYLFVNAAQKHTNTRSNNSPRACKCVCTQKFQNICHQYVHGFVAMYMRVQLLIYVNGLGTGKAPFNRYLTPGCTSATLIAECLNTCIRLEPSQKNSRPHVKWFTVNALAAVTDLDSNIYVFSVTAAIGYTADRQTRDLARVNPKQNFLRRDTS
jgi:hypothetical protein